VIIKFNLLRREKGSPYSIEMLHPQGATKRVAQRSYSCRIF